MPGTAKVKTKIKPRVKKNQTFDIIINGTPYRVRKERISFDEIVDLAYPDGNRGALIKFTVNFYKGAGRPVEGKVTKRRKIKIKDGTVFNVTRTDRS